MSNKGLFITIEGCEGVGKSTQKKLLKEYFEKKDIPTLFTREPGGTVVAEKIRDIILDPSHKIQPLTELFLYQAARREHIVNKIIPALNAGKIVVCDRFIYSSIAYQGYGRGINLNLIKDLNSFAIKGVEIDLAIFLDLEPHQGFLRKGGADKSDRMDSEDLEFHKKVYKGYLELVRERKMIAIDASRSKEEVFDDILHKINACYRHKRLRY